MTHLTVSQFCADLAGTVETTARTTQYVDDVLGPEKSGVYSEREVDEYLAHPNKLKRLPRGRALLIKGTEECAIIQVEYEPSQPSGPFAPVIPRTWNEGDREQLGHHHPLLDLAALVEKTEAQAVGAPVKRKENRPEEAQSEGADQ